MTNFENNFADLQPNAEVQEDLDSAARQLGLERIQAWGVRKTEKSGAKRSKRAREKAAAQGVKQLSVSLPEEMHPLVKDMAARLKAGETIESAAVALVPGIRPLLDSMPKWRRLLLRWLLPAALWNFYST